MSIGYIDRAGENLGLQTVKGKVSTVLGNPSGYASIDDAVFAARTLTAGVAPAAAVLRSIDRFYLKEVITVAAWSMPRPYDGIGSHGERAFVFNRSEVKALVDGDVVIHAGKLGMRIPFQPAH